MVFEGPMMIIAVTALTIFHPGRVFDGLWKASGQGRKGVANYTKDGAYMLGDDHEELTQRERKNGVHVREDPSY